MDGEKSWHSSPCLAVEGHVYLLRIRDAKGNRFYVLLKVAAVDIHSRYMAFLWRKLPGGKVIKDKP